MRLLNEVEVCKVDDVCRDVVNGVDVVELDVDELGSSGAMLLMISCCMSVFEMQMKLSWMMNKMMLMSDPMLLM